MPKKIKYKKPHRRTGNQLYRPRGRSSVNVERAEGILKGIFGTAAIALLIFLGYSIGAPIHRYFSEKKIAETTVTETAWEPPVSEEKVTETAPVTEAPVTEKKPETTAAPKIENANIMAYAISSDSYKDPDALRSELALIKDSGFNSAVIVMKDEDGYFYYKTSSEYALSSDNGNIRSDMTASEIADIISEYGLMPIAEISVLKDSEYYGADSGLSYTTEYGGIWTDSSGKPWLSPYSGETMEYISQITEELAEAGFGCIICSGIEFPELEKDDYAEIGEALAFGDRYSALVKTANIAYESAAKHGSEVIIKVSMDDLAKRKAEVFRPDELKCKRAAILCDDSSVDGISQSDERWGGMTIIPCYHGSDPDTALRTFIDSGFRESVIY